MHDYGAQEGRTFCINPETRAISISWDSDSTAVSNVSNIWEKRLVQRSVRARSGG